MRIKNNVLNSMIGLVEQAREQLIRVNKEDCDDFDQSDLSLYDRLKVNDEKVDEMIRSLQEVLAKPDPIGEVLYQYDHPNGCKIENKTTAFGKILIIYESRPDVTIEAAAIAFKSGNHIVLKGGKESLRSNLILVDCWHAALDQNGLERSWVEYLTLDRLQTQQYLKENKDGIDLIVPRGGEGLITFVKANASCPVLVSGRGNNFLFVDESANLEMAQRIILKSKVTKISACNALDKVLIHHKIGATFISNLREALEAARVQIVTDKKMWPTEFLDYKIMIDKVDSVDDAIEKINRFSGGHSASIITDDEDHAKHFMDNVDSAAVYHNASTRFTDGGQFGMGAELAISTEKMHHRGPLGLEQLVTNKWYIKGMDKRDRKRILLKIGTSTLTKGTKSISRGKLEDIGRQIVTLKDDYEFIIVCSGAIAVAKQFVNLESAGKSIDVKQALAAIGQPHLMRIIQESFRELNLLTAQCLLSYSDFEKEESKINICNTINVLLDNDYIPIINENDTVATQEIQFGDNDKLAALTAVLLDVDLLVLATNTDGFYVDGSTLAEARNLETLTKHIEPDKSEQGTGGMTSKIESAEIAQQHGIETWLVNGWEENFIQKAFDGTSSFTRIIC